jgi:hypothetical protein
MSWEDTLRNRLGLRRSPSDALPVSIKVRAVSGCFHCRGCNPHASRILDDLARPHRKDRDFRFEEHETGPELIVYLALGTAVITLGKSVIDLITTIIKARSEGQRKGDKNNEPIELIVRGFDHKGKMFEERVLRLQAGEEATRDAVTKALTNGLQRHLPEGSATQPKIVKAKRSLRKSRAKNKSKRKS